MNGHPHPGHYQLDNFVERMPAKEWRQILLNGEDTILYHGNIVKLKARSLGYGVVEVYKELTEDQKKQRKAGGNHV